MGGWVAAAALLVCAGAFSRPGMGTAVVSLELRQVAVPCLFGSKVVSPLAAQVKRVYCAAP